MCLQDLYPHWSRAHTVQLISCLKTEISLFNESSLVKMKTCSHIMVFYETILDVLCLLFFCYTKLCNEIIVLAMLVLLHCSWIIMIVEWLALWHYSKRALGLSWGPFAWSLYVLPVLVRVLQFPPTHQKNIQVRLIGGCKLAVGVNGCLSNLCSPCDGLATCPECTPPFTQWQLRLAPVRPPPPVPIPHPSDPLERTSGLENEWMNYHEWQLLD